MPKLRDKINDYFNGAGETGQSSVLSQNTSKLTSPQETAQGFSAKGRGLLLNPYAESVDINLKDPLSTIKSAFESQFDYLKGREQTWTLLAGKIESLFKNIPEYETSNAANALIRQFSDAASEIKGVYESGSDEYKETVFSNLGESLGVYASGLNEMVSAVKEGGSEAVKSFQDAYSIAAQGGKDLNNAVRTGNMNILKTAGNYANVMVQAANSNMDLFDSSAKQTLNTYQQGAGDLLSKGASYSDLMSQAAGKAAGIYEQGAGNLLGQYGTSADLQRQIAGASADQLGLYGDQALQSQISGAGNILSLAQQRAQQNLPGLSLLQDKLGSQTAESVRRIKEYGGGSQASLGAISDMYAAQQKNLQDLAIQNAQYKDQQMQNLQNTYGTVAGMQANAYNQAGQNAVQQGNILAGAEQNAIGLTGGAQERAMANQANAYNQLASNLGAIGQFDVGTTQNATNILGSAQQNLAAQRAALGQDLTSVFGQAGQMNIGAQQYAQGALANAMQYGQAQQISAAQNLGQMQNVYGSNLGGAYQNYAQNLGGAYMQAANIGGNAVNNATNMAAQGISQGIGYNSQAGQLGIQEANNMFNYNQLMPYQNQFSYYTNQQAQMDPFNATMGYYGDVAGLGYGILGTQAQMQANAANMNNQMIMAARQPGAGQQFFGQLLQAAPAIIPFL